MINFSTSYDFILQKIDNIDPICYAKTRNYLEGSVTYLSPYLSRGVISTPQIVASLLKKGYTFEQCESLIKELCWRDYFQRVWQNKNMNEDIRFPQKTALNDSVPKSIVEAHTTIEIIDQNINHLYTIGYLHNHLRMYIASITCNIAQTHWLNPAKWMYYHLLDGDWASNVCSWQWVAGANSNKLYYANQENINKYTKSNQRETFLDIEYEQFETLAIPKVLQERIDLTLTTPLPNKHFLSLSPQKSTLLYNYYNLDPNWHKNDDMNRVLLLEPEIFNQYPISKQCIDFMLLLSENITRIQIYVGSFATSKLN